MINVTAAIIERDGTILLAKRSSTSSLPNKWEFPGGKIETGETPEECLKRELSEEFEIDAVIGDFFTEKHPAFLNFKLLYPTHQYILVFLNSCNIQVSKDQVRTHRQNRVHIGAKP